MFEHIQPYAGDPIFALVDAYMADPRPQKVNLSIGIYFDEQGRLPVLPSVQQAEVRILAEGGAKPYLPMEGDAACRAQVARLLLGDGHKAIAEGRVATIQTVGSSGGLKVGADFLKTWLPGAGVWVSDPTWDNHRAMFEGAGVKVKRPSVWTIRTSTAVTACGVWARCEPTPWQRLPRLMVTGTRSARTAKAPFAST